MPYEAQARPGMTKSPLYSNAVRGEHGDITNGVLEWEAGVIAWALNAAVKGWTLMAYEEPVPGHPAAAYGGTIYTGPKP